MFIPVKNGLHRFHGLPTSIRRAKITIKYPRKAVKTVDLTIGLNSSR